MGRPSVTLAIMAALIGTLTSAGSRLAEDVEAALLGPRPLYLVDDMDESDLRAMLRRCAAGPFERTDFSIGHRGAPLQFPEHTRSRTGRRRAWAPASWSATSPSRRTRQLVCRHSQCDLHTTTNILAVPELAAKCRQPFTPRRSAARHSGVGHVLHERHHALAEFKRLEGRMDASRSRRDHGVGLPERDAQLAHRAVLSGTLLSHAESIALFGSLGVKFTPELKAPSVAMPFDGDYTQADYAQQLIDEYKARASIRGRLCPVLRPR